MSGADPGRKINKDSRINLASVRSLLSLDDVYWLMVCRTTMRKLFMEEILLSLAGGLARGGDRRIKKNGWRNRHDRGW